MESSYNTPQKKSNEMPPFGGVQEAGTNRQFVPKNGFRHSFIITMPSFGGVQEAGTN